MDPIGARFVRLATLGDTVSANIMGARLESEGIEVRIHSQGFGPYPMTLGNMADAELWVLEDRVDEASQIMLETEVIDALAGSRSSGGSHQLRIAAAVTLAV
ncbi:MAG: DUF2007 domain-containing protein, partial [Acidimicrobiia bacterium]|nr:DUF2007 domain-containing protein [Acidimicrobiia bacterium]